jgi:hypothetical protein
MKIQRRQFLCLAAGAAALPSVSRIARAQTYPTRPIRLLVGFAPGTGADIIARLVADKLSEVLGKPVIVENVTGAAGHLADDRVAKAEPDGHTLVMAANSAIVMGPAMFEKMTYDPIKDLAPITQVYRYPNVLCVHKSVHADNVQELVALARARPGTLTFGSTGTGTMQHLAGELLKSMAKIDMQHVPYYRHGAGPDRGPDRYELWSDHDPLAASARRQNQAAGGDIPAAVCRRAGPSDHCGGRLPWVRRDGVVRPFHIRQNPTGCHLTSSPRDGTASDAARVAQASARARHRGSREYARGVFNPDQSGDSNMDEANQGNRDKDGLR